MNSSLFGIISTLCTFRLNFVFLCFRCQYQITILLKQLIRFNGPSVSYLESLVQACLITIQILDVELWVNTSDVC